MSTRRDICRRSDSELTGFRIDGHPLRSTLTEGKLRALRLCLLRIYGSGIVEGRCLHRVRGAGEDHRGRGRVVRLRGVLHRAGSGLFDDDRDVDDLLRVITVGDLYGDEVAAGLNLVRGLQSERTGSGVDRDPIEVRVPRGRRQAKGDIRRLFLRRVRGRIIEGRGGDGSVRALLNAGGGTRVEGLRRLRLGERGLLLRIRDNDRDLRHHRLGDTTEGNLDGYLVGAGRNVRTGICRDLAGRGIDGDPIRCVSTELVGGTFRNALDVLGKRVVDRRRIDGEGLAALDRVGGAVTRGAHRALAHRDRRLDDILRTIRVGDLHLYRVCTGLRIRRRRRGNRTRLRVHRDPTRVVRIAGEGRLRRGLDRELRGERDLIAGGDRRGGQRTVGHLLRGQARIVGIGIRHRLLDQHRNHDRIRGAVLVRDDNGDVVGARRDILTRLRGELTGSWVNGGPFRSAITEFVGGTSRSLLLLLGARIVEARSRDRFLSAGLDRGGRAGVARLNLVGGLLLLGCLGHVDGNDNLIRRTVAVGDLDRDIVRLRIQALRRVEGELPCLRVDGDPIRSVRTELVGGARRGLLLLLGGGIVEARAGDNLVLLARCDRGGGGGGAGVELLAQILRYRQNRHRHRDAVGGAIRVSGDNRAGVGLRFHVGTRGDRGGTGAGIYGDPVRALEGERGALGALLLLGGRRIVEARGRGLYGLACLNSVIVGRVTRLGDLRRLLRLGGNRHRDEVRIRRAVGVGDLNRDVVRGRLGACGRGGGELAGCGIDLYPIRCCPSCGVGCGDRGFVIDPAGGLYRRLFTGGDLRFVRRCRIVGDLILRGLGDLLGGDAHRYHDGSRGTVGVGDHNRNVVRARLDRGIGADRQRPIGIHRHPRRGTRALLEGGA